MGATGDGKSEMWERRSGWATMEATQKQYLQEVEQELSTLRAGFEALLSSASLSPPGAGEGAGNDGERDAQDSLEAVVTAESLVRASQSLLLIINNLKRDRALGSFAPLNASIEARKDEMDQVVETADATLAELASRVDDLLSSLEQEYYAS